jgi:integrase
MEQAKRGPRRARGSVSRNRVGNWQVRYTDPHGVRRAAGTFQRKADAEQALARVLTAIENNTWAVLDDTAGDGVDPKKVTLREASRLYTDNRMNRQGRSLSWNTAAEYPRLVDKVLTALADKPLRSITPRDIERWWSTAHQSTPAQASKSYTHLKSVMKYALKRRWIRENPCDIEGASNYRPPVEPETPTDTEVALMLELADQPMRTVIGLAAHCGLRKGEILELRRKDITTEEGPDGISWLYVQISRAVVWEGENNPKVSPPKTPGSIRSLAVPKTGGAEQVVLERLQQIPEHPETLLVSRDKAGKVHWGESMLNPHWRKLRAQAGFTGRFHALRNYHLTWYAKQGATLREVMDRGGHSTPRMALRYQRSTGRETSLLGG